jgi:hypothetical protein
MHQDIIEEAVTTNGIHNFRAENWNFYVCEEVEDVPCGKFISLEQILICITVSPSLFTE